MRKQHAPKSIIDFHENVAARVSSNALLWAYGRGCECIWVGKEDSLSILPVAVAALVMAAILHGNMNGRPMFDILWMAGQLTGSTHAAHPHGERLEIAELILAFLMFLLQLRYGFPNRLDILSSGPLRFSNSILRNDF